MCQHHCRLSNDYLFYGLFLNLVERMSLVFYLVEVYLIQFDTPNSVVVGRLEIDLAMSEVDDRCPMRNTWYVRNIAQRMFGAYRNVEVV